MNGIYLTSFVVACIVSSAKGEPVSIPRTDSGGFGNLGTGFPGNLVGNLGGGFGGGLGGGFGGGIGNIQIDPGFGGPSIIGGWGQPQITKEIKFPPPPFHLTPQTFDIKPTFPGIGIGQPQITKEFKFPPPPFDLKPQTFDIKPTFPEIGIGQPQITKEFRFPPPTFDLKPQTFDIKPTFPGIKIGYPGLVGGSSGPAGKLITSSLGPALGGVLNNAINTGVGGEVSNDPSAPGCYAGNVANVIQELLRSLGVEVRKCNSAAECGGIGTGQCGNLAGAPSVGKVCQY